MELLKIDKEGRINLEILKNLIVYIFTLRDFKICSLQNEKREEKSNCVRTHAPFHPTPFTHLYTFRLTPPPPLHACILYGWPLRLNTFL